MTPEAQAVLRSYRTEKLTMTVAWARKILGNPAATPFDKYQVCEDFVLLVREMMRDLERLAILIENLGEVLALFPAARGAYEGGLPDELTTLQDQLLEVYGKARQEGLVK